MSIIDQLVAKANEHNQPEPGDYYEDGLLYCGKCKTPRQVRLEWDGRLVVRPIPCTCREAQYRREDAEKAKQERMERLKALRMTGFPDQELAKCTFALDDNASPRITRMAHNYVTNFTAMRKNGTGLLMYGDVGCGKSYMAACIVNALIDQGVPCMMTNFTRIINRLQEKFDGRQKYIDSLNRFDLLVIDDMAVERNTEYVWEMIMTIIDGRYRAGLPLIVTTNLTPDALSDPTDIRRKRVYSRLMEMCVPVKMTGADRRMGKLKDNISMAKELLWA